MSDRDVAEEIDFELLTPLRDRQRFNRRVDRDPGMLISARNGRCCGSRTTRSAIAVMSDSTVMSRMR
ncbi:MAG: hypothetical protein WB777_09635, partial [Mycobacterium sp.]